MMIKSVIGLECQTDANKFREKLKDGGDQGGCEGLDFDNQLLKGTETNRGQGR